MDPEKCLWPVNITASHAFSLIKPFLPQEWSSVPEDEIHISRSECGIVNEVYFVSTFDNSGTDSDAKQLVIRKYVLDFTTDPTWSAWAPGNTGPLERAVIQIELQRHALGPKLYGILPDGRIEEMINCRRFTQEDSNDEQMWTSVAKSLAKIHSLDLPFPSPKHYMVKTLRGINAEMKSNIPLLKQIASKEVNEIAEYDFDSVIDWFEPMVRDSRIVFAHNDLHFGNIVVLNQPKDDQSKVMIMDFDTACYGPRCQDLGLFLIMRNNCQKYETREERDQVYRPFLEIYLSEFERHSPDCVFDKEGKDSIDHLITESLVGGMVVFLWYLYFQLKVVSMQSDNAVFNSFTNQIPMIFKIFMTARDAVVDRLKEISEGK